MVKSPVFDNKAQRIACGKRLVELRGLLGYGSNEMGRLLGISAQGYGHYEKGIRPLPTTVLRELHLRWPWLDIRWVMALDYLDYEDPDKAE